jgi:putative oxidoreductase
MKKSMGSGSSTTDFGLLVLRVCLGTSLFLKHGVEKITHFSHMAARFPDPVHIGAHASLVIALISDAICSLLVAVGLGTRVAAFIIVANLGVAFYFVHHLAFRTEHGELILIYMAGFLALIFTGAGNFSLDEKFWGRG